jgi:polygalacturonase
MLRQKYDRQKYLLHRGLVIFLPYHFPWIVFVQVPPVIGIFINQLEEIMKHTKKILAGIVLLSLNCAAATNTIGGKVNVLDLNPYEKADRIIDSIQPPQIPEGRNIDLRIYAKFDPSHQPDADFRAVMQKAIDELSTAGGGTLTISHPLGADNWFKTPVTYRLSGPIQMKSKVRLAMEPSTRLEFDFNPLVFTDNGRGYLIRYEGTLIYGPSACIRAFNATDIEIIALPGSGAMPVINGNGDQWQRWMWAGEFGPDSIPEQRSYMLLKKDVNNAAMPLQDRLCGDVTKWYLRPDLFQWLFCKRIRMEGIELQNSPFWVVHPVFSTDLVFREIKFECMNVNNDGIDPESCRRVLIERVMFNNYDDNVAIKAGRDREAREGIAVAGTEMEPINSPFIVNGRTADHCSEIVIRHNFFKGHYAICIGSEVGGGASDIYALDNTVPQEVKMLFNIKSSRSRGGIVEKVIIKGIKAHRVKDAAICLIPNYDNDTESPYPPTFRNILIEDIEIGQAGRGLLFYGWPDATTQDITLRNVQIGTVSGPKLEVMNAERIHLENVTVGDEKLDGDYNHVDQSAAAPHQM